MASPQLAPIVSDLFAALDRGAPRYAPSREAFMASEGREPSDGVLTASEILQHVDGRDGRKPDGQVSPLERERLGASLRARLGAVQGGVAASALLAVLDTPGHPGLRYGQPQRLGGRVGAIPGFDLDRAQLANAFDEVPRELGARWVLRMDLQRGPELDVMVHEGGRLRLLLGNGKEPPRELVPTPEQARRIAQRLQDFMAREHEAVVSYRDQPSWDELSVERESVGAVLRALYAVAAGVGQ